MGANQQLERHIMERNVTAALAEAQWINGIVSGTTEFTQSVREKLAAKTTANFRDHINRGFLEYRKSATIAGDFALTEWEGQGSILRDALGREFIDMLIDEAKSLAA